jgi:hypothetical protein
MWRPEARRAAPHPRLGKEGGAVSGNDDLQLAGDARPELFPARFRV